MRSPLHQLTLATLLLGSLCGCHLFTTAGEGMSDKPILPPLPVAADGVIFEIYSARFPYGREEENARLWDEIDEQAIDRDVRRRLQKNGFRAGVVSGHISRQIEELLGLKETVEQIGRPTLIEADGRPKVVQHVIHITARRGGGQIDASAVYDSLDVLTAQDGEVGGRTYLKAQCKLILSAVPQGDGSVRVQILPEVHHGQAKPGFTSFGQGILRMTTSRPSQSFEELQIIASLAPGDMLVLGCLTDRQGSLGHAFFTGRPAGPLEQKLIIVRVVHSMRDDLFATDAVDE